MRCTRSTVKSRQLERAMLSCKSGNDNFVGRKLSWRLEIALEYRFELVDSLHLQVEARAQRGLARAIGIEQSGRGYESDELLEIVGDLLALYGRA